MGNEKEALSYHQWSVWEWGNPTCTQDGYRYRTCTCGAKETEASGSAYGHNHYLSGEKDGKLVYSCRYCDDCYYERTNTRYDAALTAPEVARAESTDYYVGIKCPVDSAGAGTFGYIAVLCIDDPGQTTLEVWEGGANGYVGGKSIGANVLDYDAYRNSWIDNVIASQTNGPWFLSKRWDSCTSPAMLAVIAERIGGFEEIHNCFGDDPRGTYEWAIYHHQTYVIYQGEKHYFSVCPLSSSGEVEYQTIDFSNTAQFTRFG